MVQVAVKTECFLATQLVQSASWKVAAGTSAIFLESGSAAQRLGASTRARAHTPGTALNSRGGRQRPAHAAEHPGPLHLRLN